MQPLESPDLHRFCVAPMLDWTTPECRALHRLFTRHALLYTEMVTTGALIYGDAERHLQHQADAPCALQLGGGEPEALARACEIALPYDYQEINLNVGCPSDRVQNNRIRDAGCRVLERDAAGSGRGTCDRQAPPRH